MVLVTGGASGIGRATAERFLKGGATVVILDLSTSDGVRVASDLGEKCTFVAGDVSSSFSNVFRIIDNDSPIFVVKFRLNCTYM